MRPFAFRDRGTRVGLDVLAGTVIAPTLGPAHLITHHQERGQPPFGTALALSSNVVATMARFKRLFPTGPEQK